jgi:hypothetical protein
MDLYKMLRSAGKSSGIRNDYMLWMEKFVTHSDEVEWDRQKIFIHSDFI